ncbi:thioredoxin domain-containing protein [Opitutus sp. ER46]|uniref:thioredoxin domain-containing protein n=1 Tax=Opitutus sp. ER46 TaxID=2161864 RepID=UPI000D30EFD3|nr:thioredoxin domain-containing protein [Opitutus sp. ER46]PTX95510.1 thioredoxin domain-containing protein [Opitutus sp. ER46]
MPNALAQEKSPYLLQHADNPVAWLPWGETAWAKARAEQKPIFLSIGYSTCHWCHVMAHESFEHPEIAALLNAHYVPVKVDREERPDVDRVYMAYVQAMTGHGGWPLNAWLTPDLKPFYGGTYFPPEDRPGRPGFPAVLGAIAHAWENERDKLMAEGERVIEALRGHFAGEAEGGVGEAGSPPAGGGLVEAASRAFEDGFKHYYEGFDPTHAGFGGAPKFPRAANLTFLLRVAALQGGDTELGREAVMMVAATLQAMARGGLHDHVGGGFHRYSVDDRWFVPHFEKMLYDQAQIAVNCLEAGQATGDERFAWLARDVLDYVRRDLADPAGGYYTAEDADSLLAADRPEHAEGAYYVWSYADFQAALGDDAGWVAAHFGVKEGGNVPAEYDPHGELQGKNILAQQRPLTETAAAAKLDPAEANDRLLTALARLRAARAARPRPHRDDKIVTANNGLMISALARAHQVLGGRPEAGTEAEEYLLAAVRAAEFVRRELADETGGRLWRSWRQGRSNIPGFAEDYAFLIQGLLDLYEAGFDLRWLQWAEQLQGTMDAQFWDDQAGGYFNSAADDPSLVLRLKEDYDGAEPAPSSVAALNLFRLAAMLNREELRAQGRRTLEAFRARWTRAPHALPQMMSALELALEPPRHGVIAGDPATPEFRRLVSVLHEKLGPRRVLLAATGGESQAWLAQRSPWLKEMIAVDGRPTVYLCEEFTCRAPVSDPGVLRQQLG